MRCYTKYGSVQECIEDILHRQPPDTNVRYFCPVCGEAEGKLELKYDSSGMRVIGRCWRASCGARAYRQLEGMEWARKYTGSSVTPRPHAQIDTTLPKDFIARIPKSYEHWLLKHYITEQHVQEYGIGWSQSLERLIFPSVVDKVEGYCARSNMVSPKWINKMTTRVYPSCNRSGEGVLVLVEDPLSAIRVGDICDAASILGTQAQKKVLDFLNVKCYNSVVWWLDSDIAGMKGIHSMIKQWKVWYPQTPLRVLFSDLDPKRYSEAVLRDKLKEFVEVLNGEG